MFLGCLPEILIPECFVAMLVEEDPRCCKKGKSCAASQATNPHVTSIPTDRIEVRDSDGFVVINGVCATAVCYKIIVPDKVMLIEFADHKYEKMVLREGDKFSIDAGIRIAIAKHVGKKYYNSKGIEALAVKLEGMKCIDKIIHRCHVENRRRAEAEKKAAEQKKRQAEIQKNKKAADQKRRLNIKKSKHSDKTDK